MIVFGKRIEPMVDEYLIESREGLRFEKEEPVSLGMVLSFDRPWEGRGSLGTSLIDKDGQVKLYYRGYPDGVLGDDNTLQTVCLAVSEDGIHFERYPVNEIPYGEDKKNNILFMGTEGHNFAPFYDENPNCPLEERYKAVAGIEELGGIYVYGSADGVHFRPLCDRAVITDGKFDSLNMAFYDTVSGVYRCYYRYYDERLKNDRMPWGCRAIESASSADFLHWSAPVKNEYAEGTVKDQLYTNATRPIPGAEHILLSMPMRFEQNRKRVSDFEGNPAGSLGVSDAVLMTSRDGIFWDRTLRTPYLSGGLDPHEWTQRNFIPVGGIAVRGDMFYFYAEKRYMWDDDGIFAYAVPRYRFLSLSAEEEGGCFVSKPLLFESDDIYLNYATGAYGYLKVKLENETGQPLFESEEIYGNELSYRLHASGLAGKRGRMTVKMREARLYAIGAPMK